MLDNISMEVEILDKELVFVISENDSQGSYVVASASIDLADLKKALANVEIGSIAKEKQ